MRRDTEELPLTPEFAAALLLGSAARYYKGRSSLLFAVYDRGENSELHARVRRALGVED